MMAFLEPERYFARVSKVDIRKDIVDRGFKHVLLDVDNTILTRDTHEVPRDILLWLAMVRTAGLELCLISNNWHHGVHDLAAELALPIVSHAVKPLPPAFLVAMAKVGAKRKTTLVIGDQLITDVIGAHFLGLPAYLICPLVEHDLKHTLMLRTIEQAIIGKRHPEGASFEGRTNSSVASSDKGKAPDWKGMP